MIRPSSAHLRAGGMGEVYRADDPRLGRDVAIKVLPPGFSGDADRLRRSRQLDAVHVRWWEVDP